MSDPWGGIPTEYRNAVVTGDARELSRAIPDGSVDLVFTDPVYDRIEDYEWLGREAARVLKPGGACLAFCGVKDLLAALRALEAGGLLYRGILAWNLKGPANKRYGRAIDNGAWLAWLGGWPVNYTPLVWDSTPANETVFRWQKNPNLTARHVSDFSERGGTVWDPFVGGGTTAHACKATGRNFIAFEIDPETAALARERVRLTPEPLLVLDAEPAQMGLALE